MHLTDEALIRHHLGEPDETGRVAAHLARCGDCREALESLAAVLAAFDGPALPEPDRAYGAAVWRAIEGRLTTPAPVLRRWAPVAPRVWIPHVALAAGLAALLAVGFAGSAWLPGHWLGEASREGATAVDARDRILVAAVADHLDRAARMLTEINNAESPADVVDAMALADDLASANRLYRQAAAQSGETDMVSLLDDLERVLLDVAHDETPAPGAPDLDHLRERLETRDAAHRLQLAKSTLD